MSASAFVEGALPLEYPYRMDLLTAWLLTVFFWVGVGAVAGTAFLVVAAPVVLTRPTLSMLYGLARMPAAFVAGARQGWREKRSGTSGNLER